MFMKTDVKYIDFTKHCFLNFNIEHSDVLYKSTLYATYYIKPQSECPKTKRGKRRWLAKCQTIEVYIKDLHNGRV